MLTLYVVTDIRNVCFDKNDLATDQSRNQRCIGGHGRLHETKGEHYETFLEGIQLFSVCGTSPMEQTSSISSRSLSVGHLRVLSSIAWL